MSLNPKYSNSAYRLQEEYMILDDSGWACSRCWTGVVNINVFGDENNPEGNLPPDPFGMEEEEEATGDGDCLPYDEGSGCSQAVPFGFLPSDPFEMEGAASQGCPDGVVLLFCEDCRGESGEEGNASSLSVCESFTTVSSSEELPNCQEGSFPYYGWLLSLKYLRVQDLLAAEMVCKSLRYAVQNEFSLLKCIHINSLLSERLTDDALLRLTLKAQGKLQCLSLVGCPTITDEGLKLVLDSNPRLIKLSLPGCVKITIGDLINNLSTLKVRGALCLKQLRLGRLFKVTKEHYEELNSILDVEQLQKAKLWKPKFYYSTTFSQNCDDDARP